MRLRVALPLVLALILPARPAGALPAEFESAYVSYETGARCGDVALGDLDGDGYVDMVVASTGPAMVTVRRGTAEGTFPSSQSIPLGSAGVTAISLADLNNDGHLDLLANNSPAATFQYRFGDGLGGFGAAQTIAAPTVIANVQAADFNEDGWTDLAYAYGSNMALRYGTGGGNFGALNSSSVGAGSQFTALLAGDVTADGHADVTMVLRAGTTYRLWCRVGDGHGAFTDQLSVTAGPYVSLHRADMTGDGTPDIVLAGPAGAPVTVARGLGGGLFTTAATVAVDATSTRAVALDADGDGRLDLCAGGSVYLANVDGTYTAPILLHLPMASGLATAALNGDAHPDLVVTNGYASAYVLLGRGDGSFGILAEGALARPIDWGAQLADLTGDGRLDLVTSMAGPSSGGVIHVRPGLGDGTFGPGIESPITRHAEGIAVGDFDGDATPDIAYAYYELGYNRTGFLKGQGDGSFGPTQFLWSSADDPVGAADFNGDGHLDLVALSAVWVTIYPGLGNGDFDVPNAVGLYTEGVAGRVIVTDLNGDSRPDVMSASAPRKCASCGGAALYYWLNDGAGGFGPRQSLMEGHALTGAVVGDFDEDGWLDAASAYWIQDTDLTGERLVLFRGSGPGTFLPPVTFPMQAAARGLEAADLDGDGHLDILSAGYYSTAVVVHNGTGTGGFQSDRAWGTVAAPAQVLIGTLDGDARPDILALTSTFNPANPGAATVTQRYTLLRQPAAVSAVPDEPARGPWLAPVMPNPARGRTLLRYALPAPGRVRLEVFDVQGRLVNRLLDGPQGVGVHAVAWEGRDEAGRRVAPGVYLYRLVSAGGIRASRFVLLP